MCNALLQVKRHVTAKIEYHLKKCNGSFRFHLSTFVKTPIFRGFFVLARVLLYIRVKKRKTQFFNKV